MVVTESITRLNTRLLQPCFMVVTTLNYNLVTTLLHPCNKVVISVWETAPNHVQTCPAHDQDIPWSPPSYFLFSIANLPVLLGTEESETGNGKWNNNAPGLLTAIAS